MAKKEPKNVKNLIAKHSKPEPQPKHSKADRHPLTDRGVPTDSRLRIPQWLKWWI